jgi:probable F420-dependent oxidoreductase
MSFRIETVMHGPDTDQYAGKGSQCATIADIAGDARSLEELGFDGITAPEAGHDPYLPLAIAAEHTERVRLATNVAIAFPRSPLATAQVAWDLQHLSGGRFALGLGTQVKGHNERRYATPWTGPPGPRLRDYVLCLRAMFASFQNPDEPTFHEGEYYRFTLMSPFFNPGPIAHPHVPIHIAAVNTYMAQLSGELCDGLRLHPIATFRYTEEILQERILQGVGKAGRQRGDVELIGAPFLALGADEAELERSKSEIKQHIAFYASTRTYHAVLEHHDWLEVGLRLHELSKKGKWTEMPLQISDEMLDEWAIVASYDEFPSKLKERAQGAFDTIMLDLPAALRRDKDRVRDIVKALR